MNTSYMMKRLFGILIILTIALSIVHSDETKTDVSTLEEIYERMANTASQSVVSITVDRESDETEKANEQEETPIIPMMRSAPIKRPVGVVTGTIIDSDGYIVTTYFNIRGKLNKITVTLADGKKHDAKLIGYDGRRDIALLKIDVYGLPVIKKGDVKNLKIGQMIVAMGINPDSTAPTVTPGIISAVNRFYGWFIQTDARVNFGNVGGPLLNTNGELLGITCYSSDSPNFMWGQSSGVGFVTTIDKIEETLPALKKGKKSKGDKPAFLGVKFPQNTEDSDEEGAKIEGILPDTAAEKAGLKSGDVITEFDGRKVSSIVELRQAIFLKSAGDRVKIKFTRDGKEVSKKIILGDRPTRPTQ